MKPSITTGRRAKSGQVALFLVFVVVGIFTLVILNVDVWAAITGKNRTQNAGDAAALAAARGIRTARDGEGAVRSLQEYHATIR